MPIHDWSSVSSGLFHHFHQTWSVAISDVLNDGVLPTGLMALVEQRIRSKMPDLLAIEVDGGDDYSLDSIESSGVAIAEKPTATIIRQTENEIYTVLANRIVVRHALGRIVAVIEILSPGNKDSRGAIREIVEKTSGLIREGVHVMLIDLFGPSRRDPVGIHKLVWDEFQVEDFELPPGKDRMVVSYEGSPGPVAYIEPLAIGDRLPIMPLLLTKHLHVQVPLEEIYMATWNKLPAAAMAAVKV